MTTAATAPKTNAQTTPAVRPTRRAPAAWLLAGLLAGIGASASALDVTFSQPPSDSVVVEGHAIAFRVTDNLDPNGFLPPTYQWYRNGVAIPGATAPYYRFTAQRGDDGARYHVVAQGQLQTKLNTDARAFVGPTASSAATLTVLAAGSSLAPQITAPVGDIIYLPPNENYNFREFRAQGNDLQWSYRRADEPPANWHSLSTDTDGVQVVVINVGSSVETPPNLTVRVIDDSGTFATRTWQFVLQAPAYDVIFNPPPFASTLVAGHWVTLCVKDNLDPTQSPAYQWYRNDAAIAGATAQTYRFSAQLADDGARYHVVARGLDKSAHACGPTASSKATLTVLPAGSALAPAITAPPGDTLWIPADQTQNNWAFQATGNDLQWAYRFDSEPADQWHVLSAGTNGTQIVAIDITPPAGGTRITVRVLDDAAVFATRTWWVVRNHPPTIVTPPVATPSTVVWPGPVTLSGLTATDPDGDALTYTWSKLSGLGNVTLVPNAHSPNCTATFTKFGNYTLQVMVRDGRGGLVAASVGVTVTPNFDTRADLNNDGVVNALDLGIVLDNFGAAVP